MLSVILTILKIIGIVIAVLVGLILLIVLLVSFVPIRYKGAAIFPYEGELDEEVVIRRKRENLKKKVNSGKEIVYTEEVSEKSIKIKADAVVSWLLHIVHVTYAMDSTASVLTVRLFGLFKIYSNDPETLKKKEEKKKKKEEKKKKKEEKERLKAAKNGKAEKSEDGDTEEDTVKVTEETEKKENENKEEDKDIKENSAEEKNTENKEESEKEAEKEEKDKEEQDKEKQEETDGKDGGEKKEDSKEDAEFEEDDESSDENKGILGKIEKIKNKLAGIKKKIDFILETKDDPRVRNGVSYAKKKLFIIIKRLLPKKLKGRVAFGMDDPATTGYITGGASLFYPLWGRNFILEPDFENKKLEADVNLKGRIMIGMLAIPALKVWFNKDIKYIRRKVDEFKKL